MDFVCPYKCSYRTNIGYCGSTGGWESCQYRRLHQSNTVVDYVPLPKQTNGDRIRAMSDEELAEFLWNRDIDIVEKASKATGFTFTVDRKQCLKNVLGWLKQEADNGQN